jgi:hypothetical protein
LISNSSHQTEVAEGEIRTRMKLENKNKIRVFSQIGFFIILRKILSSGEDAT